jgi:hypothetical protein
VKKIIALFVAAGALMLVGCQQGSESGSVGGTNNAEIPDKVKEAKVPEEAKQAIANMTQNLPPGAARPVVQPDGTVKMEPGKK